jgi:hypothetical protein
VRSRRWRGKEGEGSPWGGAEVEAAGVASSGETDRSSCEMIWERSRGLKKGDKEAVEYGPCRTACRTTKAATKRNSIA